jgi:hypothetical protein
LAEQATEEAGEDAHRDDTMQMQIMHQGLVFCKSSMNDPDDRDREKQLLASKRALDEALLSVRRQFAPPSVDSGSDRKIVRVYLRGHEP